MNNEPEIGDTLYFRSPPGRVVRIIEIHRGLTGDVRRVRVENLRSERRTFLAWPPSPGRLR